MHYTSQERPLLNDYIDYQNMAINASASSMWVANSSTLLQVQIQKIIN